MLNSDRIQTTHVGSLPRTPELLAANEAHQAGSITWDELVATMQQGVKDIVATQRGIGIDIVNDGEYGHTMSSSVDYGAWWNYSFSRLGGLSPSDEDRWDPKAGARRSSPGHIVLTSFADRRDRQRFSDAYADESSGILTARKRVTQPKITGPLTYTGQDAVQADIAHLKAALSESGAEQGFIAALSPGSCARVTNEHYATEEELVYACADAMREEYRAIVDAGLIVQIDDPSIAESWDQINPEPSLADYRSFLQLRIEALNHALRGLPQEQIRFHLCWGSWHGPHTTDLELKHLIGPMLQIDAGGYTFEAGSARHAHEWGEWADAALPEDKVIIPGVVSHSTNVVEHPELVAQRIERFASVVGRERVIASTDCGLGGRLHPQIALAKLESLAAGAELASARLF